MSFESWGRGGGYGAVESGGDSGGGGGNRSASGYQRSSGRDGDSEYIRLSQRITDNIHTITSNVSSLQKMTKFIGTQRDKPEMHGRITTLREETSILIRDTFDILKQLTSFDGGSASEARKRSMQCDRLKKDLKNVIDKFQAISQVAVSKERDVVVHERERADSVRGGGRGGGGGGGGGYGGSGGYTDDRQGLMEDDQRRQMQEMDEQVDYSEAMIREREEGIKEIESTMLQINEIYRDINNMVVEQGTQLDNIEANMSSAEASVDTGTTHLGNAQILQKKSRNKMCCLLLIVAIVAAVLTIVLVTTLKKKK